MEKWKEVSMSKKDDDDDKRRQEEEDEKRREEEVYGREETKDDLMDPVPDKYFEDDDVRQKYWDDNG